MTEAATVGNITQLTTAAAPPPAPVAFTERDQFELALRKAKVYASSTLVPAQYQDNLPNCLIALNMAKRIGADELMVMQNLFVVQGKPGWSAQFLIASFNQCGRFSSMRFEWKGEQGKPEWGCRAYATERATGEIIRGAWVTWAMAVAEGWTKKNGSKWLTMPEQMAMYRAAAFLVRAYAPEIAMGLQTVEELRDVIDVDPEPAPTKTDAVTAALKARIAPTLEPEPLTLDGSAPPPMTFAAVADAIAHAKTADALDLARDLIRSVESEQHRAELDVALRARLKEITK